MSICLRSTTPSQRMLRWRVGSSRMCFWSVVRSPLWVQPNSAKGQAEPALGQALRCFFRSSRAIFVAPHELGQSPGNRGHAYSPMRLSEG